MISTNDFKNGMTIEVDNNIYTILEFQHVKPGKGPAFVRTKLKNLRTGATIDKTFNAGVKVGTAHIDKKSMQFLYSMNNTYYFMDMTTYEQVELDRSMIEDSVKYLKENLEVEVVFFEGELLGLNLPDKVTMKIVRSEEAVKGNTTSGALKDAEVETGYVLKVPLFVGEGEEIVISTKDGKYVSRA